MAATYAFRLEATGASQIEAETAAARRSLTSFQSTADALRASSSTAAGGVDALTTSLDRTATGTANASRQMGAWINALNRAAAAADPVEAAYQKAARAEEALLAVQARGRTVTDAQVRGVSVLRSEYEKLRSTSDKASSGIALQR
jgi:uncharacterized phage infection (PIP) family protein YhgE